MRLGKFAPYAALVLAALLAAGQSRALYAVWEVEEAGGSARLTSPPGGVDFGSVEIGNVSKMIKLTLVNDDDLNSTTVSNVHWDDAAIVGILYDGFTPPPYTIAPGGLKNTYWQYKNEELLGNSDGNITFVYSIDAGTDELIVPWNVTGVEEGYFMKKPDEGLFLGPCFLETLKAR